LVVLYKASGEYEKLAASTKRNWAPWLDRIGDHFGELQVAQFDRPEKIRPVIRQWRNRWADKPRTADYGLQVLSRVLSYAVDPLGRLAGNPCEGIKQLYSGDRSEIIWTAADIAQLKKTCSAEIACAVDLASHTGLRLGDLLRLSWSHVGGDAIIIATGKSKGRRDAIIPLYGALEKILAEIPKRSTTVLTNSRRRPWTADGFGSSFNKAKIDAASPAAICISTIFAARRRPGSTPRACRSASSPKSWPGKRSTWRELSVAMSDDRRPQRRSFDSSTGPKYERNLQNRLQNREGETG
jgi:integrase